MRRQLIQVVLGCILMGAGAGLGYLLALTFYGPSLSPCDPSCVVPTRVVPIPHPYLGRPLFTPDAGLGSVMFQKLQ